MPCVAGDRTAGYALVRVAVDRFDTECLGGHRGSSGARCEMSLVRDVYVDALLPSADLTTKSSGWFVLLT
jgi:hypothetical protein